MFLRKGSPFLQVRFKALPGFGDTSELTTKTTNEDLAERMEALIKDIADRAIIVPEWRVLLDKLKAKELDLPTLYQNRDNLAELIHRGNDPSFVDLLVRLLETDKDYMCLRYAEVLRRRTPADRRLSWYTAKNITDLCLNFEKGIGTKGGQPIKRNSVRRGPLRVISKILTAELGKTQRRVIFENVNFKAEDDSRKIHLTTGELKSLLSFMTPEAQLVVRFAVETGADRGVILGKWVIDKTTGKNRWIPGLRKRDFEIEIDEEGEFVGSVWLEDRKTAKRSRRVAICGDLAKDCAERLFTRLSADPLIDIRYSQWDNIWRRARKKANLTHVRFKDLRHTFLGLAERSGASLATIKVAAGHSRIEQTSQYIDQKAAWSLENARKVADLLGKTG